MSTAASSTHQQRRGGTPASFKPGQSGNPAGRAKKTDAERDLEALCRAKSPEALGTILELMLGSSDKVRLSAAQYVIDRGYGKAVSRTELTGKDGEDIKIQNIPLLIAGVEAKKAK